jgi:DsbC/DsbD-like thiol-disulfide interchange protein
MLRCFLLMLTLAITGAVGAQTADELVRGELVSDASAIVPGKAFRLGVHLNILPDWHVYWKHPGETGMPTTVRLELPDGFVAGEVQYPVPRRFVQPGDIAGFGYADETMLLIDVTAPAQLQAERINITATVSFLVCEKVCIPGKLELEIELPAGASDEPRHDEVFSEWTPRIPRNVEPTEVTGTLREDEFAEFSATVPLDQPADELDVFPQTPDALQTSDWSVEGGDAFAVVRFKAKILRGLKLENPALPILLAYTDSRGMRTGVSSEVPLRNAVPKN